MLWEKVKDVLKDKLPASSHSLWIEPVQCLRADEAVLELSCPDRFFLTWVSENYLAQIQDSLAELGRDGVQVQLAVARSAASRYLLPGPVEKEQLRLPLVPQVRSFVRSLHPRYTFDEFMVGESNLLAQSACKAISQGDTTFGSHLYIHSGTGLGKSHLIHAVAHHILANAPGTRLHYLTAQQFSAEMVQRLRKNEMDNFKDKYHHQCDILLVEDVHTLTGKAKTQTEFDEVLDCLMKSGKRIILTGAVAPAELRDLDEGIRSRMAAGLISPIASPDYQTRTLIIRRKAANNNLHLSEDLIEYIARRVKGDVRKLESTIVGLKAKSSLLRLEPDLELVKSVIDETVGDSRQLTTERIRDFVASQFKLPAEELMTRSRRKAIALPRQISMFLARKLTEEGLAEIGRAFNRDHATVLHSIRVITETMARNNSIRGQVDLLESRLKQ